MNTEKKADRQLKKLIVKGDYLKIRYYENEKDEIRKEIGERIKILRKNAGLSQIQTANILDISNNRLLEIEKGRRDITVSILYDMSQLFQVSSNFILSGKEICLESDISEIIKDKNVIELKWVIRLLKAHFKME